jgi:hypothetical protein
MTIIIIIPLNGYLLTCRLNSKGTYYKTSTKTRIKHKTLQIHKHKTLNEANKTKQ